MRVRVLARDAVGDRDNARRRPVPSELVSRADPVVPVADGLLGGLVYGYAFQLRQRHGEVAAIPVTSTLAPTRSGEMRR